MKATVEKNSPPPPQRGSAITAISRMAGASLWLLAVFAGATGATGFMAAHLGSGLLWNTDCFLAWGTLVSLIHYLYFRFQIADLRETEMVGEAGVDRDPRIRCCRGFSARGRWPA